MLTLTTLFSNQIAINKGGLDVILNPFELYTIPLKDWITNSVNFVVDNYRPFFQAIRLPISLVLETIQALFLAIPPLIFLILIGLLAWQIAGRKIAIYSVIALSLIGFIGAWEEAMVSLALVVTAVVFCMVVGITLGILSASNPRVEKWLKPLLDAMQTLPSFVYLVPVVMLFGIGEVSGVIATFIFAVPPLIRLTSLGIKQVSEEVVEAATAFGSTPNQVLWEVQIPLAMPTILAGVNQAILLALSMSVVTSMIGVEGLGGMVLRGLGQVNVGLASVGGLSIVLIAIMLDRITNVVGNSTQLPWQERGPIGFFASQPRNQKIIWGSFATTVALILLFSSLWKPASQVATGLQNLPGAGIKVKSAHSSLIEERFQTEIINLGLRQLGYETPEPKQIEYVTMLLALGNGDLDYMGVFWDPGHGTFFEKGGGEEKLKKLGIVTPALLQGYQIDKKTADKYNITSLDQLKDPAIAKLFDSDGDGKANLTGCNSGWNCQLVIDHHLKAYGLEDTVEHDRGSYSALIVDTITRYKEGSSVLYYTWTPQWMSAVLEPGKDVIWLDVPFTSLPGGEKHLTEKETSYEGQNLGFPISSMRVVANKKFANNNPAAKRLFELVSVPVEEINAQNQLLKQGEDSIADIRRHAREWVENHQDLFDDWVEEAMKASETVSN